MKMLDGIWFAVDGQWLKGTSFSNGWGYARYGEVSTSGVGVSRTDFFPDGVRAGLVGLTFTSRNPRSIQLTMNAHSELMKSYPWGETTPSQTAYNLPDTGSFNGRSLVFREQGTPPVANAEAHDYAAVVGSTLTPTSAHLGPDFRGPQDPAVICPASGPNAPQQPDRCDDTAYGRGTGGELGYTVKLSKDTPKTVWFAVAGSDKGLADATISGPRPSPTRPACSRRRSRSGGISPPVRRCHCPVTGNFSRAWNGASRTLPTPGRRLRTWRCE